MIKRIYLEVLIWLSLSVFIAAKSFQLGIGTVRAPGPGFLPFLLSLFLFLLSVFLILERNGKTGKLDLRASAFLIICLIVGYVLVFKRMGFLLSTFLLMAALFRIMGTRRWRWVAFEASLVTAVSYVLFGLLLGLNLPAGIF